MRSLRDAWLVAGFDLMESLRSRKVLVFGVLYVAGAAAAMWIFAEILREVEQTLAAQLLVARTDRPGDLTQALVQSREMREILRRLVRDRQVAAALVEVPPAALLYGWVALTFAPIFVVLTSSDAISSEVATGSVRFAIFRTDRTAWAVGKLLGQAALSGAGIAAGAISAYAVAAWQLGAFDAVATAGWMASYAFGAFVYSFAFLGVALGVSQLTRSVPWSRALGLLALALVYGAHAILTRDAVVEAAPVLSDTVRQILPPAHRLDLWRASFADRVPAIVVLVALAVTAFSAGHLRFARRDA